jgi:predicted dehydrogenase
VTAPIRIVVIGAGLIGRKHIGRIADHPDFVLAGIADVAETVTREVYPDVPVSANVETLLDEVRPEAVIVSSPNALHLDHGLACAARGIPFIMEKPVADTLEAADRLVAAVRKSGVATLVGRHRRHHAQALGARQLLADGLIGRIVGVSGVWATAKPAPYFEAGPWRKEPGGGPILINLIHEIDMLRFLLGEIAEVAAFGSRAMRGFAVEDSAAITLRFHSGALGTVLLSDAAVSPWTMEQGTGESVEFPFSGQSGYRFLGTEGALEFPGLTLWRQQGDQPHWNRPAVAQSLFSGRRDPYEAQLSHFRDVVRGKVTSLQPVEDGVKTLLATLAVRRSAETGAVVQLNAEA